MTKLRNTLLLILGIAVMTGLLSAKVSAISSSEWSAGRITDDAIYFNSGTMGAGEIQAFLNAKVPTCDTNGTQMRGNITRAQHGTSSGYPPPYTCLKDYNENIPNKSADAYCDGSISTGTKSAAQIIYDVSRACGINPQALIVLLQKEQSLVTDDWPWSIQYRSATGYGCPDTAACDSAYYGFFNQVYNAARQFKRYARQANLFNYRAATTSYVQYNPNSGCGGSNIYIANASTAGLYNYTPYQPNQAALNNLYGTGDSCSAYGNRNYWRMFNDWFGSSRSSETNYIRRMKKTSFSDKQQVVTMTDTQLYMNAWWSGSNGIQRVLLATSPSGERLLDFDIVNEPDDTTQTIYLATESGVYKMQGSGTSFGSVSKIITRANTKRVVYERVVEGGANTYRLYVLANDGPYEYWWRDGQSISDGYRFWNINNGISIVKTTDPSGKDEVYVATNGNVYRMKWPVSGDVERTGITSLTDTVDIQKQNLDDGTELLYTATKTGVHETWWRPGTGFSDPAKIIRVDGAQSVVTIQKKVTAGYQQIYIALTGYVLECWWGPGSNGVHCSDLIKISQNNISSIDKTTTGNFQNLYTAYQSFVFETWWGNGKLNYGPAIINLNQ